MKLNIKKLILVLSITILGISVVACSNSEKEENTKNTLQQEEKIDNTVSEDEPQVKEEISEEEALKICKEKLKEIWSSDWLKLGTNEAGLDKIVSVNDKEYYGIYYINDDIVGDFRFLVDKSTGEVFYDTVPILENLIPVDQYIAELEGDNSSTSTETSDNVKQFTMREAIELTLKYIGKNADEIGDRYAITDEFSINIYSIDDKPLNKNGELYYSIELDMPNSDGRYALCAEWYISSSGNLYYSNGDYLSQLPSDISDRLVDKNEIWS